MHVSHVVWGRGGGQVARDIVGSEWSKGVSVKNHSPTLANVRSQSTSTVSCAIVGMLFPCCWSVGELVSITFGAHSRLWRSRNCFAVSVRRTCHVVHKYILRGVVTDINQCTSPVPQPISCSPLLHCCCRPAIYWSLQLSEGNPSTLVPMSVTNALSVQNCSSNLATAPRCMAIQLHTSMYLGNGRSCLWC